MTAAATDRRAARRETTRQEIIDAAWALGAEHGLTGWAMRDLGTRVGMTASSLYSYFAGKHDIYDAMFAEGYREFADVIEAEQAARPDDPRAALDSMAIAYFDFCIADPIRYQLLFQRTIPGFEPSPESFAVALCVHDAVRSRLADADIVGDDAVDLWTAVLTGLVSQQIANDPGGDRWRRLLPTVVQMTHRQTGPTDPDS